jgi:hypothetical protein
MHGAIWLLVRNISAYPLSESPSQIINLAETPIHVRLQFIPIARGFQFAQMKSVPSVNGRDNIKFVPISLASESPAA